MKNDDPQKITIKGVWGGQLDVERGKTKGKSRSEGGQKSETILAYLPPFVRNVLSEPDGFLINSASDKSFNAYILNSDNAILDTITPKRIGESNIWQYKVSPKIFAKMQKLIINREGNLS